MTQPDDELTPEQAERVRRLLAEARHDEPMPDAVAARLDAVIAGLAEERDVGADDGADDSTATGNRTGAPVVRLAERRRKAARLLLAAAAVVVGGVAVGQVVGGGVGGSGGSADEATSAEDSGGLPAPQREEAGEGEELPDTAGGGDTSARRSVSKADPQTLRSRRFAADAEQLRPVARGGLDVMSQESRDADLATTCAAGDWGGGRYLQVVVDGEGGWLVYRPVQGNSQVVDLFLCGEDDPERTATLPVD